MLVHHGILLGNSAGRAHDRLNSIGLIICTLLESSLDKGCKGFHRSYGESVFVFVRPRSRTEINGSTVPCSYQEFSSILLARVGMAE